MAKKKATVAAGELSVWATLRKLATTSDGSGGRQEVPTDVASMWIGVRPAYAYEAERLKSLRTEVTHIVTIRYTGTIDNRMWFEFNNRRLNIQGKVNVEEADRKLTVYCLELEGTR